MPEIIFTQLTSQILVEFRNLFVEILVVGVKPFKQQHKAGRK